MALFREEYPVTPIVGERRCGLAPLKRPDTPAQRSRESDGSSAVSTYRQDEERYVVQCDAPGEEEGDRVSSRGEGVAFGEVVAMILRHLSIVDVAGSGV